MRTAGLSKQYGDVTALHPIDLDVRQGELLTLLGPSGSGKTTLLQIISGLTPPTAGQLFIDGLDKTQALVHQRDIGVVFQNYALFPHLTVFENIAFPLQMRRTDRAAIKQKVMHALEMVGLATFSARFPRELSGGQQQRVALARCLVYQPSLLLMDESLSALDRKLRQNMQVEIKRIHRETGATIIFVTHDQEEALALSDRICLMNSGRIEQIGTPDAIYERPDTAFVAEFIGISNKLTGKVTADGYLATADGPLPLPPTQPGKPPAQVNSEAMIIVRPESMRLERSAEAGHLSAQVIERIYGGADTRLLVRLQSGTVLTVLQHKSAHGNAIGDTVWLDWAPQDARLLEH
jgi:putative spermidine/putrescine transport system ATP-binding protein